VKLFGCRKRIKRVLFSTKLGHTDFRAHNCWNVVCFPAGDGLVTHVPHTAPKMDLEGAGDGSVGKHKDMPCCICRILPSLLETSATRVDPEKDLIRLMTKQLLHFHYKVGGVALPGIPE